MDTRYGNLDYVSTNKPLHYQVKCRAYNQQEAEEKLNKMWLDICTKAYQEGKFTLKFTKQGYIKGMAFFPCEDKNNGMEKDNSNKTKK